MTTTAGRIAIHAGIFLVVTVVLTAVTIWFDTGPALLSP